MPRYFEDGVQHWRRSMYSNEHRDIVKFSTLHCFSCYSHFAYRHAWKMATATTEI